MAKHRIRITGTGIHGLPATPENPTGEYPAGYEFETDSDLPPGWKGRAVIVGEEPKDAVFVVGEGDSDEVAQAKRDLIEKAEAEFKRRDEAHAEQVRTLNAEIEALKARLAGGEESATADEIKAALALLDGKTDAHWTKAGLPAVDAVADLTGKTVTREAITEAAPDAKRPA